MPIEAGGEAACTRCASVLYRQSGVSLGGWVALTLTALVVFTIANYFPIVTLNFKGLEVRATLLDALWVTWQQGHVILALMTALFAFWLPLTQILFLLWALLALASGRLPWDFRYGLRFLRILSRWSMVPVLMLGILVAIVKLAGLALLTVEPGLWAFAVLTVLLTALSQVSAQRLWRYAEDAGLVSVSGANVDLDATVAACPSCGYVQNMGPAKRCVCRRCGATFHFRKPRSFARCWAFVIAASILYIPANVLPVMQIRTFGVTTGHTIVGGVIELWRTGSWSLAVIVFIASVVVPMTKLFALAFLMLRHRWKGVLIQRQRTRMYELVEFVGQWSMLDVFVVILLSAMANFPGFSGVSADMGAASFGVVVILTMFAAMSFDPRIGWDNRPVPVGEYGGQPSSSINKNLLQGRARHPVSTRNA